MSLPIALDTNLLARLVTNDDPQQALQVADLIDASAACFVPITVVLELEWVLRGAYKLAPPAVIQAFEGLMDITQLHLEQEDLVRQALELHRHGLDFADALHHASWDAHPPTTLLHSGGPDPPSQDRARQHGEPWLFAVAPRRGRKRPRNSCQVPPELMPNVGDTGAV